MISISAIVICTFMFMFLLTGCSGLRELVDTFRASDETLEQLTDPAGSRDPSMETDRYKEYIDEKTGESVTKVQYNFYRIVDGLKYYGALICVPLAAVGFMIRRVVKSSATIRKYGLAMELLLVLYVIVLYVLAAVADAA